MALQLQSARAASPAAARPAPAVLVVDDENGVRDLMSRWLTAGGFSVSSAAGADEALGLMRRVPPAVALCDIRMPGHDGVWLANRIRQEHPETAIIMATGVYDHGHATHLGDGVVDYLTKPFGRDRLRDAVVRGVEWHRSARDARCWRDRLEGEVELRRDRLARAIGASLVDSDETIVALLGALTAGQPEAFRPRHAGRGSLGAHRERDGPGRGGGDDDPPRRPAARPRQAGDARGAARQARAADQRGGGGDPARTTRSAPTWSPASPISRMPPPSSAMPESGSTAWTGPAGRAPTTCPSARGSSPPLMPTTP